MTKKELLEKLHAKGIEMSETQADEVLEKLKAEPKNLPDEELGNVAGGWARTTWILYYCPKCEKVCYTQTCDKCGMLCKPSLRM